MLIRLTSHYRACKLLTIGGLFLLLVLNISCNKKLDIDSSRIANEEVFWKKYEDARSSLFGIYGLFRAAIAEDNAHWLWGELRMGDFTALSRPDLKAVINNDLKVSFPNIQNITNWRKFYAVINACNLFIERADECLVDKRYTESYYKLDIAQARALRAFAYFYMVRIWGDVPFITSSQDGGSFEELPRTNQNVVLSFAEQELIEAAPRLPYLYSADDPEQLYPSNYYNRNQGEWLNTPISKLGAYAILAHIAAWQSQYIDVAAYTEFIVANATKSNIKICTTEELIGTVFNRGVGGNYFQLVGLDFVKENGETTVDGHIENFTLANTIDFEMSKQLPDIYITKSTISELFPFKNGNDSRFGVDVTSGLFTESYFENYTSEIPVFKKIRVVDGGAGDGRFAVFNSSIVFTRFEEIRLLRAEAFAALNQPTLAASEINVVRSARSLSSIEYTPGETDIWEEVFQERRRELLGEGWRWYDQVRYQKGKRNNPEFNQLLDQGGIYWPISQDVLNNNSLITQNAYWQ